MTRCEHYTSEQLDAFAIADLLADAIQAEQQANEGPFYPENGVTRETCTEYAANCRAKLERYKNGGGHRAVLMGEI